MKNAQRTALALVLVGALIGLYLRVGPGRVVPYQEPRFDFWGRSDLTGKEIGPFVIEELVDRENYSLRLRSRECGGAIFMTPAHIIKATPEALIASLYPAAEWRTLYVYRGQAYDNFARFPAYLRFLATRLITQITLSPLDVSDTVFFSFYVPVACSLDRGAAIAASNALIALVASPRQL